MTSVIDGLSLGLYCRHCFATSCRGCPIVSRMVASFLPEMQQRLQTCQAFLPALTFSQHFKEEDPKGPHIGGAPNSFAKASGAMYIGVPAALARQSKLVPSFTLVSPISQTCMKRWHLDLCKTEYFNTSHQYTTL